MESLFVTSLLNPLLNDKRYCFPAPTVFRNSDMEGIRKRFGTQVYLDSTDLLRSCKLNALSSGYFYQGENEELHFEYFLVNGGSKLDSLLLTF
jgi:hypothetical protein